MVDTSNSDNYWVKMLRAAEDKTTPRASERRHFRGKACINCINYFIQRRLLPEVWIDWVIGSAKCCTLNEITSNVGQWPLFGPWIGFKIADMLERLQLCKVEFCVSDVFNMFDTPRKGAQLMSDEEGPANRKVELWAYNRVIRELGEYLAPPSYERTINIQEVETILCKWKSHMGGHYRIGNDSQHIHKSLNRYSSASQLARHMIAKGDELNLWQLQL